MYSGRNFSIVLHHFLIVYKNRLRKAIKMDTILEILNIK